MQLDQAHSIKEEISQQAEGFFSKSASYYAQVSLGVPFTGKPLDPMVVGKSTDTDKNMLQLSTISK